MRVANVLSYPMNILTHAHFVYKFQQQRLTNFLDGICTFGWRFNSPFFNVRFRIPHQRVWTLKIRFVCFRLVAKICCGFYLLESILIKIHPCECKDFFCCIKRISSNVPIENKLISVFDRIFSNSLIIH